MLDLDGAVGSSLSTHIYWSTIKLPAVTLGKRQLLSVSLPF